MFVRSSKLRERIEASVEAAKRAADMAAQRVEITLSRTQTAQERAENAVQAAKRARDDADTARICAIQFDPTFQQPGIEHIRQNRSRHGILENHAYANHVSFESTTSPNQNSPHHRLVSGPSSSISTDPYNANMPNFAPQQLYQQQQSLNTQTPIIHNNSHSPAELYDTSQQPSNPQHEYIAQHPHYEDVNNQMTRVDEEAAYILQQQASSSSAQNQLTPQQHVIHLQNQQPQFSLSAEVS
jgi:hypothetical protein